MKTLGSENCINLNFRDMWAFVVKKRGPVSAEGYRKSPNFDSWAEPLTIQALVTLQSEDAESCLWEDNEISQRRKEFCEKYEGYGSVCSCKCDIIIALYFSCFVLLLYLQGDSMAQKVVRWVFMRMFLGLNPALSVGWICL